MSDTVPSVVAIDIGTHKVSVLIGRVHALDRIEVIGMAHAPNRGMSKGSIRSLDKVVAAIKDAVSQAEDMADCRIHTAWVAIPSAELKSFNASGRTPVMNQTITTTEVVRTLEMAKSSHLMPDHYLTNAVSLGVAIDDHPEWVDHPINMSANFISGHYHLMMLPINTMQNLDKAMKNAGIGVERMIISTLATSEAVLLKDEKEYGVCMIDIGAGTTNVAVYLEGRLILSSTIQQGGEHVTRDIASVMQTSTEQAEILKIRHGCVDLSAVKPDQMIQIPGVGASIGMVKSRIELSEVIAARYEEIFDEVRQQLENSGAINVLRHGVVLTGDACQIEGAVSLARRVLGVSAHLGNPPMVVDASSELRPLLRRSIYATASGLLMYSQNEQQRATEVGDEAVSGDGWLQHYVIQPWQGLIDRLKQLV
jgi:cell division protein FtsA